MSPEVDLPGAAGVLRVPDDGVLGLVLDATNTGLWIWDLATDRVRWSAESFRIHGLAPGDFAGTGAAFFELVHAEDRERVRISVLSAISDRRPYCEEFRIVRPDGSVRWVMNRGRASRDVDGTAEAVVGTITDVTDRHRHARQLLQQQEQQLRLFVEQAPAAIAMFDRDMRYLGVSRRYAEDFAPAIDTLVGRSHYEVFPDLPQRWREIHARCLAGLSERADRDPFVRADGSVAWLKWELRPWRSDDGAIGGLLLFCEIVNDRVEAEDRLRRNAEAFQHLIEDNPFGVYVVDADFRLAHVSKGSRRVFENVHPLLGRDFAEVLRSIWPEPEASDFIARFRDTLETGRPYEAPRTVASRLDIAATEAYDWRIERIVLTDGRHGVVCYFYDLSERQRQEKQLLDSEARLRRIIDSMFAFVGMLEPDGTLVEVNSAPLELAGLTREDVIGRRFWECAWWSHDPAVAERVQEAFRCAASGSVVRYDEIARVAGDGRMDVDLMLQPVFEDGRLLWVIPSGVDVTARNRADRQLRLSEQRFRVAVDATSGILWTNDPSGRMSGEQPGWAAFTGQTLEQYQGYRWAAAVHPEDAEPTIRAWEASVASASKFEFEHRLRRHDGVYRTFRIQALPVRDAEGAVREWVGVHTDITDTRHAADLLREADRRKDVFLATLSHELRNPLAPLQTAASLLADPRMDSQQLSWAQAVVQRQVRHLSRLLDDLLDVARITQDKITLRRERVVLAEVIDAAVEIARPGIDRRQHQLRLALPVEPVVLEVDPLRIAQVLSNLLTNAAKYTDPGGQIDLSARLAGDHLHIVVEDDGIGIPGHALPKLFDMFWQPDTSPERAEGGLGIGLALVKGLVELHGGRVTAASAGSGRGSRFVVTLPVAGATAGPATGRRSAPL